MSNTMCGTIAEELEGIHLGDKRLNERSKKLVTALAVDPQPSINAACKGWNETHAAYQFLDQTCVTPEKIQEPHRTATLRRIRSRPWS